MKRTITLFVLLVLLTCSVKVFAQTFVQLTPWGSTSDVMEKLNDSIYLLSYNDGQHGYEPWISDGTAAGTFLLKNIKPGTSNSIAFYPDEINVAQVSDTVWIFIANDGMHGEELWRTNGTGNGTYLLKDIVPGSESSNANINGAVNNKAIFTAWDGTGYDTWVTDGTDAGTLKIITGEYPHYAGAVLNNQFYFFTYTAPNADRSLWVSDGVTFTELFTTPYANGYNDFILVTAGDQVFFSATDSDHGTELWKSDGTIAGTQLVKDLQPGIASTYITKMVAFGDQILFSGSDPEWNYHMWQSDGTSAGTNLVFGNDTVSQQYPLIGVMENNAYFNTSYYDDSSHVVLWMMEENSGSPHFIKDIANFPASNEIYAGAEFAYVNDRFIFSTTFEGYFGAESWLYSTDGTSAGTLLIDHNNYSYDEQGPTFHSFASLCDSVYLIDVNTDGQYTLSNPFAVTDGQELYDFSLFTDTLYDVRLLFADDTIIFLRIDKAFNYTSALFAYAPCSQGLPLGIPEAEKTSYLEIAPNPVSASAVISFSNQSSSQVVIELYNIEGCKVRTVFAESIAGSNHWVVFNKEDLSPGFYLVRMVSEEGIRTRKILIE